MINTTNKNSEEIAKSLPDNFLVLDIGGAVAPFQRADYIVDIVPYEEVSWNQQRGAGGARVTKETYVQHDICSREPWPFKDKQFDYVFCSHVLEDIRDPLWVCSELSRVSKAGYIEVPSKLYEMTFNLEADGLSGACHHRWLIDVFENKLRFTFKHFYIHFPFINKNKKRLNLNHNDMLLRIEWSDSIDYFENWLLSGKEIFEYYLDRKITDKERWSLVRKTSPHNFISAWARYLKNTSPFFEKVYLKLFK